MSADADTSPASLRLAAEALGVTAVGDLEITIGVKYPPA